MKILEVLCRACVICISRVAQLCRYIVRGLGNLRWQHRLSHDVHELYFTKKSCHLLKNKRKNIIYGLIKFAFVCSQEIILPICPHELLGFTVLFIFVSLKLIDKIN